MSKPIHKVPQGFQESFEIGPLQFNEPVELPVVAPTSASSTSFELSTPEVEDKYQRTDEASVPVAITNKSPGSPLCLRQISKAPLHGTQNQYTSKNSYNTNLAAYSSISGELAAARRDTQHQSPTTESASSQIRNGPQALRINPLRANTAPRRLPKSYPSPREMGTAKRSEREHRKPPLSFAAKQRLSRNTSASTRLDTPLVNHQRLQYMSSASTISSVVSDVSEVSVADSIDEEAFKRRARERAERELLKLMPSTQSLAGSEME